MLIIRSYILSISQANDRQPSSNVRLLSRVSSIASTAHSIAAFASFLIFLVSGRYRTLLDRILRLRLAPSSSQVSREISFEYLNRQLVWHAFTEFLLFLLPLVGIRRWKRWLSRAWRKTKALVKNGSEEEEATSKGELAFLPERTCAICYLDQNPTSTSENEIMAISGASGELWAQLRQISRTHTKLFHAGAFTASPALPRGLWPKKEKGGSAYVVET